MATLHLESITCDVAGDWDGTDDPVLSVDGVVRWKPGAISGGTPHAIHCDPIPFSGKAVVELMDEDDGYYLDDPIGSAQEVSGAAEASSQKMTFEGDGSRYVLTYSVTLAADEIGDKEPIDCPEYGDGDDVSIDPPDGGVSIDDPAQPCPLARLVVIVQEPDGAPIEGATVSVCPLGLSGTTVADGSVDFGDGAEGVYTIEAWKDNHVPLPATETAALTAGESTLVTVTLSELAMEFLSDETAGAYIDPRENYFPFLIGQGRQVRVRWKKPLPGATADWQVAPVGNHSGVIAANTGAGVEFTFTPTVTNAQRPVTDSRAANAAIEYDVTLRVTVDGETSAPLTQRITQDERDIIRQEYLDFWMFRGAGFNIPIPTRDQIQAPNPPNLNTHFARGTALSNYNLVLDAGMGRMYRAVQAAVPASLAGVGSGWRNPRRNRAANGVVNSNHQRGHAVDMAPVAAAGSAARRRDLLEIYRAALAAGGTEVLLEQMANQLYPGNTDFPLPSAADPDRDGDGLPDNATHNGRNLRTIFNEATHVHGSF